MGRQEQYCILIPADTPLFIHLYYALDHCLPSWLTGRVHRALLPGTTDQPNDAKIAQKIATGGWIDGKVLLGGVCDPTQAAINGLSIHAALVKRLGFYLVAKASKYDSPLDALAGGHIKRIFAHGGEILNRKNGRPQYTSTAQALAACLKKHFHLNNATIEHCSYDALSIEEDDLAVTCNFPLVLGLRGIGAVQAHLLSDVVPEWSRLFLSGLALGTLTQNHLEVLKEVIYALQRACRQLRFISSPDEMKSVLNRYFPKELEPKKFAELSHHYGISPARIAGLDIPKNLADELTEKRIVPSNVEVTKLGAHLNDALWDSARLASGVVYTRKTRLAVLMNRGRGWPANRNKPSSLCIDPHIAEKARKDTARPSLILEQDTLSQPHFLYGPVDIVVLTALDEEMETVKRFFPEPQPLALQKGHLKNSLLVEIPTGETLTKKRKVLLISTGAPGRLASALVTMNILDKWKPKIIILAGIMGGFSECVDLTGLNYGDVVVPNRVVDYEGQKIEKTENGYEPKFRDLSYVLNRPLTELAKAVTTQNIWHERILHPRPDGVKIAPKGRWLDKERGCILCGDKVVADSLFLKPIRDKYPEAMGVEMESAGVAAAIANCGSNVKYIVLKAVSDFADHHKNSELTTKWRNYALESSAAFVQAVVSHPSLDFVIT